MDPFTKGIKWLNDFQTSVLDDCLIKGSGGLSLPMGSGKTLISILFSLQLTPDLILVVCAKSLIPVWECEIHKFFGNRLKYEVFFGKINQEWRPNKNTRLILTTIDMVSKIYKKYIVDQYLISYRNVDDFIIIKDYISPSEPFLHLPTGDAFLFSNKWGCLIVDECQHYTNINTARCQGLVSICAKYRWALSGTLFNEPKIERLLGYYLILNIPNSPRCLPDMENMIRDRRFGGLNETIVSRDKNIAYKTPIINEEIISHNLCEEEAQIYLTIRNTIHQVRSQLDLYKFRGEIENVKTFSCYMLALITYLRQCLVCPVIPIASISVNFIDSNKKTELSNILMEEIRHLGIDDWLNKESSACSTRIKEVIKLVKKHKKDRIVVFSCFRVCINILAYFLPENREILTLSGNMAIKKRKFVIEEFEKTKNGILLLTYDIGSEGLNLQTSNTVILMDFWWNSSKTHQAIARILRYGQKSLIVNIYFLTSNTGMEKALFQKQHSKQVIIEELKHGSTMKKVERMNMREVVRLIDNEENIQEFKKANNMYIC